MAAYSMDLYGTEIVSASRWRFSLGSAPKPKAGDHPTHDRFGEVRTLNRPGLASPLQQASYPGLADAETLGDLGASIGPVVAGGDDPLA